MIAYLDHDIQPLIFGKDHKDQLVDCSHYAVINEKNEIIGTIEQDELSDYPNLNLNVNQALVIDHSNHLLLLMMQMKELDTDVLFLAENGLYRGAISYKSIIHYLQDSFNVNFNDAFLTMSVSRYAFSLSELARIAESEGSKIIYFHTRWVDMENLELDVIFDNSDLKRVIGILEQKGYHVTHFYNETGLVDHLKARYENLMSYLNV